jgi:hypothetical protein
MRGAVPRILGFSGESCVRKTSRREPRSSPDGGGTSLRRFNVRAEFRRLDRDSAWVVAGVWVANEFYPAAPGVEPVRRRLPDAGLVGWVELDPVLARSPEHAASVALELASGRWPKARRAAIPHP